MSRSTPKTDCGCGWMRGQYIYADIVGSLGPCIIEQEDTQDGLLFRGWDGWSVERVGRHSEKSDHDNLEQRLGWGTFRLCIGNGFYGSFSLGSAIPHAL
jgi:hypothetical protein